VAVVEATPAPAVIEAKVENMQTPKATVEDCDDDDGDADNYVDDATLLAEPEIKCVEPENIKPIQPKIDSALGAAGATSADAETEKILRTRIHYIKEGKLSYFTFVESVMMKNNTAPEETPAPAAPAAAPAEVVGKEKTAEEKALDVDNVKKSTIAQEFVRVASLCSEQLRLTVENPENPLAKLDKDITNSVLQIRTQRKTRQPNLQEEPLLIARTFALPPSPEYPLGDAWSPIEVSNARDPKVSRLFDEDLLHKYDALEPNNSGVRLLIVETAMKGDSIEARVRLYCFFSVKWKYDKQGEKFLNARNGKKKGEPKLLGKPDTAIVGPVNVEQGGTQYLESDSILVLATFWACQPIERQREAFLDKFLGKQKAALKKAFAKADTESIIEEDVAVAAVSSAITSDSVTAKIKEAVKDADAIANDNEKKETPESTPSAASAEAAATAAALTDKKEDELSEEIKAEIKKMSDNYKAKCLTIEVCVADYSRRRLIARKAALQTRVPLIISFVLMSYGCDLCIRHQLAAPNIPEPLAFIVVTQRNGSIVNMDETTCVDESVLATYMKTEPHETPTMRMYVELMAALKSKNFNPRHQVVVHILERGQYQDRGQNVRVTVHADVDYEKTEAFVNQQLAKHAQSGQPRTVAELAQQRVRQLKMAKQMNEQPQSAPAT